MERRLEDVFSSNHHVEKSGGRGIGGWKSALCWEASCVRPVWKRARGGWKALGGGLVSVPSKSCTQGEKNNYVVVVVLEFVTSPHYVAQQTNCVHSKKGYVVLVLV
jgi:hypothetical protein